MSSYMITLIENRIQVSEYLDGDLTILKNRGEKEQNYNESKFWFWFKEKIEYENEKLSFVIVTDNKEFIIPSFTNIKLDEKNNLDNDNYINNILSSISKGFFVLFFPKKDTSTVNNKKKLEKAKEKEDKPISEDVLVDYFRKQTQGFKNE